ncbi:hypothetical protein BKA63DRAFT_464387 [Paraphoma chrysanthemicola]|nr:hypothetical protein BKA63DRAFT_464387 [Paraphoma chrysanthemicola]
MGLTLALGERYLWVDRLCIVQNDVGDGGTLSQVAKMDKIYAGAYLTIIAAATDKITTSLLHVEDMSALSEKEIVNIMSARYGSLSRSRWATRGWTYQEQILCKRAVVLVDWGFFWDCQCSIWDGVDLVPGQDFDGVRLRADMGQRFATRWWPDFGFYLDLICPYNGREFSYPQDTLLGISGVLNALGNSFPGGFIHGLPRLFLDHTLLWQPFGTAERRLGRREDEEIRTSLPSWSWAGWQCYRSEPILEPLELDKLVGLGYTHQDDMNLTDWVVVERDSRQSQSNDTYWYNKRESWTYFRHPIPISGSCVNRNLLAAQAYLTCSTTTATYLPVTVLHKKGQNSWCSFGPPKISVFEDRIFSSGPRNDKVCSVLVLQRPNGGFGGLLRMMVNDIIDEYASIELIAISKGSATARDMRQSFEWRIYETAQDAEWDLLHSWYRARLELFGAIPKVAGDLVDGFDRVPASAKARPSEVDEKILCEFYNVLWIERRDGMAYRRACGWVPKHVWEANATGPIEVKLG